MTLKVDRTNPKFSSSSKIALYKFYDLCLLTLCFLSFTLVNFLKRITMSLLYMFIYAGDRADLITLNVLLLANIHNFQGNLLNKVELEIVVAELVGDDLDVYAPPRNMVLYRDSEEFGIPVFVEDAALAIGNSTYFFGGVRSDALPSTIANLNRFFGGNIEDGYEGGVLFKRYRLNLTSQCVEFLRDESLNTKINIAPFIKAERPNRCIIFGPKHSVFPAKVNIKYTKP